MSAPGSNGGSAITSYSLEWSLDGQSYTILTGDPANNILLTHTQTSLTKSTTYHYRYRVRNIHGWSPYSPVTQQVAAKVPDAPVAPVTENTATSVKISFAAPYDGGSPVTTFNV